MLLPVVGTRYTCLYNRAPTHPCQDSIAVSGNGEGGAENLTNFVQLDVIIASSDPFGPYFDASQIWGRPWGSTLMWGSGMR